MKLITLEFQELSDRNKIVKELFDKRGWGYRSYNKNGKYYIEYGVVGK